MTGSRVNDREPWIASLERPTFDISENRPINALHYRWANKQKLRYDMHYGLELGILLKGQLRRVYRNSRFDIKPGQVWLCGMWEPHGYQITKAPCETVVLIVFPPALAKTQHDPNHIVRLLAPFEVPPNRRPQIPDQLKKSAIALGESFKSIINNNHKNADVWLSLKLVEILLVLMDNWKVLRTSREKYSYPAAKINKAMDMVFANKRLVSTQEAAKVCGMNRNAFGKRFRETMGITFSEFGLRYRISSVAELLRSSDKPIKAIASEWGFTDTSHLHRCFRKYYNCSPTEYKTQVR